MVKLMPQRADPLLLKELYFSLNIRFICSDCGVKVKFPPLKDTSTSSI